VPRRLRYTDEALADLDAARNWLVQPGAGPVARGKLASIWASIEALVDRPCQWPVGAHRGVRELPCTGGWRALYEVDPDTGHNATAGDVRVLRVYGPGQDRHKFGRS